MKLIYAIQHDVTKRIYVGSTGSQMRIAHHMAAIKSGRHSVQLINEDCENHGFKFTTYMLEMIPDDLASSREHYWMNYFDTANPDHGYNYKDYFARKHDISSFPIYSDDIWRGILMSHIEGDA